MPIVLDGEAGSHERLRSDLTSEERCARRRVGRVNAAKEVPVQTFDIEDAPEILGDGV